MNSSLFSGLSPSWSSSAVSAATNGATSACASAQSSSPNRSRQSTVAIPSLRSESRICCWRSLSGGAWTLIGRPPADERGGERGVPGGSPVKSASGRRGSVGEAWLPPRERAEGGRSRGRWYRPVCQHLAADALCIEAVRAQGLVVAAALRHLGDADLLD